MQKASGRRHQAEGSCGSTVATIEEQLSVVSHRVTHSLDGTVGANAFVPGWLMQEDIIYSTSKGYP